MDRLFVSQSMRILLTTGLLFLVRIPLVYKIIGIILLDTLDCDIPNILFTNWINCKSNKSNKIDKTIYYQKKDKFIDTICHTLLLLYILNNKVFGNRFTIIIVLLYLYRLIGTYIFLKKENRKYLFYFPNFFLEITLGFSMINYIPFLKKYTFIILLSIIIFKILLEYNLHYKYII